jgi:hypothetical protein
MKSTVSARVRIQLFRMVRPEYWERRGGGLRRSVTSRPYPTAARCSLLLIVPVVATLQSMRSLDLFSEKSIRHYLGIILRNKLAAILKLAA